MDTEDDREFEKALQQYGAGAGWRQSVLYGFDGLALWFVPLLSWYEPVFGLSRRDPLTQGALAVSLVVSLPLLVAAHKRMRLARLIRLERKGAEPAERALGSAATAFSLFYNNLLYLGTAALLGNILLNGQVPDAVNWLLSSSLSAAFVYLNATAARQRAHGTA
ncbi:hypothetical protein CDCA_CDCA10G2943 [Cyanidium caldarium]|uniref:Translocon-associated protein subunit gamma n=1 Tax=Cyanidium caldarium TaxID=2771 RepID=A0AAV9IXU0_CYACA|nr:hypothetical protein CDCA_CDCA10G2943 [Cyanidium caldarium]